MRLLSAEEARQLEKEWGIDDDEVVITFNPGWGPNPPRARAASRPPRAPRFPRTKSLAWLRELAGDWERCPGASLFLTTSTPLYELDDAPRKAIENTSVRTLLSLGWSNVPGLSSDWTVEALDFGGASRLYLERRRDEGLCLLAYSDDRSRARSDAAFLHDFFSSNGERYGTFIMGGPPSAAEGSADVSNDLLVELLVRGMKALRWYEPIPDDLEALARSIVRRRRIR